MTPYHSGVCQHRIQTICAWNSTRQVGSWFISVWLIIQTRDESMAPAGQVQQRLPNSNFRGRQLKPTYYGERGRRAGDISKWHVIVVCGAICRRPGGRSAQSSVEPLCDYDTKTLNINHYNLNVGTGGSPIAHTLPTPRAKIFAGPWSENTDTGLDCALHACVSRRRPRKAEVNAMKTR